MSSYCPVEQTIQLLSRKYVVGIIYDMFNGKTHFSEFLESNPKLDNKSLSRCLKYMQENALVERVVDPKDSSSTQYFLTEKCIRLYKVIFELANFTLETYDKFSDGQKEDLIKRIKNQE